MKGGACAPSRHNHSVRGVTGRRGGTSRTGANRAGECDGLAGLPETNRGGPDPTAWSPPARIPSDPLPWMRFIFYQDRRKVAAALKGVYTAPWAAGYFSDTACFVFQAALLEPRNSRFTSLGV